MAPKLSLLAAPLALAALGLSAGAQTAARAEVHSELTHATPTLPFMPAPGGSLQQGLALGDWHEPSLAKTGSMAARLLDEDGALEYDLYGVVSEYVALGSSMRFGGIRGRLFEGSNPLPIEVVGSWVIDLPENRGTFEIELFLGGFSPTAPLLSLGSVEGRIGKPGGYPAAGGAGVAPGGVAPKGATSGSGGAAPAVPARIQVEPVAQLPQAPGPSPTSGGSPSGPCTAGGTPAAASGVGVAPSGIPAPSAPKGSLSAASAAASTPIGAGLASPSAGGGGAGGSASGAAGASQIVVRSLHGQWIVI